MPRVNAPALAAIAAFALALLAPAGPLGRSAEAQTVADVEPRAVVAVGDGVSIRCGTFEGFYEIARLEPGQLLVLDGMKEEGEDQPVARVRYPAWQHALLPAADGRPEGRVVVVTRPTTLKAIFPDNIVTGSWRSVYNSDVAAGTRLELVRAVDAADGTAGGYIVVPPAPPEAPHHPWAFTELANLRDATEAEIAAHDAALEAGLTGRPSEIAALAAGEIEPPEPAADEPADDNAADASQAARDTGTADDTADATERAADAIDAAADSFSETAEDGIDRTLLDEQRPTNVAANGASASDQTQSPTEPEAPAAETQPQPQSENETETALEPPVIITPRPLPAEPAPGGPLAAADLDAELARVRSLGGSALEDTLDELIAEFRRARAATPPGRVANRLDARIAWLELRRDARDQQRRIDAALARAEEGDAALGDTARRVSARGVYDVVGRLVPSALYDGTRLPLMYRVQSVESGGVRTLAYVRPGPNADQAARLGRLVGIVGTARIDDALRLRVIRPDTIDVLDARPVTP